MFSSKLKFLCGMIAACLLAFVPAVGEAQKDLQKEIQKLKKRVAGLEEATEPMFLTVDCGAGDTVTDALAEAETTTGYVTITIEGTCVEEAVVSRDNVTMEEASPGSGIQAPGPDNSALVLRGVRNVTLDSLSLKGDVNSTAPVLHLESSHAIRLNFVNIEGGEAGLLADHGVSFHASGLRVAGTSEIGIDVGSASSGDIYGSMICNNLRTGISVRGHLKLMESDLINNDLSGLSVIGGSASVMMSTSFRSNGRAFRASEGARIGMEEFTIEDSTVQVADVTGASHVELSGGSISDNRSGFLIGDKSSVYVNDVEVTGTRAGGGAVFSLWTDSYLSLGNAKINGNFRSAIQLYDTSILQAYSSEIIGNSGWGIYCEGPPALARIAISCNNEVNSNSGGNNNCPDATPWWFCDP